MTTLDYSQLFDLFNEAMRKIAAASTPQELLEAASDYARSRGAAGGKLFQVNDLQNPEWAVLIASWEDVPQLYIPLGTRFYTIDTPQAILARLQSSKPIMMPDILTHELMVDSKSLPLMASVGIRGFVQLPIYARGRWWGGITFDWLTPQEVTEADEQVYTALIQQVSSAADSLFLAGAMNRSTEELERFTHEMQVLFDAAQRLNMATTPEEQLDALSDYARAHGATQGVLFYIDRPEIDPIESASVVAQWATNPAHVLPMYTSFKTLQLSFAREILALPARPSLITDVQTHEGVDREFLEIAIHYHLRASAVLPINSGRRWVGFVWFGWDHPHEFSDTDYRVYVALQQQATGVIDSLRLLDQTKRRAKELEEANEEIDLLYRASEAINTAASYQEVVEAVAPFDPEADVVTLMLWENLDWNTATYIDTLVVIDRNGDSVLSPGMRIPRDNFPIANKMIGERVWLFEDVVNDPRVDKFTAENWLALDIHSFMGPALYINKRWLGGVTFHSKRPRRYSEREVRLFSGIGDLILTAMERIRLENERERSRWRAEMLAKVSTALLRATDELSILEAVALYTHTLKVDAMNLVYIDTDELTGDRGWRPVAVWIHGKSEYFDPEQHIGPLYRNEEISNYWVEHPDETLFVENIVEDTRFSEASRAEYIRTVKTRAFALMPLVMGGMYHGLLRITWSQPRTFSEDEKYILGALIQNLPSVVASRRNYLAERQRARELEAVARVSAAATSILEETHLLRTLHDLANDQFQDYDIQIRTFETDYQLSEIFDASSEASNDGNISRIVKDAVKSQALIINDIRRPTPYKFTPITDHVKSIMVIPLLAGERLLGVLEIQSDVINRFTAYDKRVMSTLADLIAVAIQNARLYRRAQAYAALEERNRLARELHDSVSQALYGIALGARTARKMLDRDPAQVAKPLDYVLSLSEAGLAEMRALIFELRPETLEKEGLVEALDKQVTMLKARYGIEVETTFCPEPDIPLTIKEGLYWIAREAMHNVVKHAQASLVRLTIDYTDRQLVLTVLDNGVGFDPGSDFTGHFGLKSMSERCRQIGGELIIKSRPGEGSQISISVTTQPR